MCYSTTQRFISPKSKLMAFPGVVKPWPMQPHGQYHPFAPPWNPPSAHQVATSPLATNVHSTNAQVLYKQQRLPQLAASPVKTSGSPVTTSPPSISPPIFYQPVSTVSEVTGPSTPHMTTSVTSVTATASLPNGTIHTVTDTNPLPPPPPPLPAPPKCQSGNMSPSPKKKRVRRKRCWTCDGCQRKENCGTCSVCTNTHTTNSVCKMRRCEVLKRRPSISCPTPAAFTPTESPQAFDFASLGIDRLGQAPQTHSPLKEIQPEFKVTPPKRKRKGTGSYKPSIKEPPPCGCPGSDEGFYYTHLGAGPTPEKLREALEQRFSVKGNQLRMVEVTFCGIEAKTAEGCPTAEWVIRRKDKEELFCIVYRHHKGHICDNVYSVISIVLWDGLSHARALHIYRHFTTILPTYGFPTPRKCEHNESKTCSCQGSDKETRGCSFSFGCSWSVYYDGCKFAKSRVPRKFKLQDQSKEEELESTVQSLSTDLAPVYKWLAPEAFKNQVATQEEGVECRLGFGEERPWSGITACMDFCAHSHYDRHNMTHGGATLVCTILKKGVLGKEDNSEETSEQLHVLPLYRLKNPPERSIPGIEIRPVEGDLQEVGYEEPTRTEEEVKRIIAASQGLSSSLNNADNTGSKSTPSREFPSLNLNGPSQAGSLTRVSSNSPPILSDPQTPSPVVSNLSSGYGSMSSVPQTPSTPTPSAPGTSQQSRPPFQFPDMRVNNPAPFTTPPSQTGTPTLQQNHGYPAPSVNGFHTQLLNGIHRMSPVGPYSQPQPVKQAVKQEHQMTPTLPRPVDTLMASSSSCTDSDSDCYMVTESSPATSQESPSLPKHVKLEQQAPPAPATGMNGFHHIPPSLFSPQVKNPQPMNGLTFPHQLDRKVSFATSPLPDSLCRTPDSVPRTFTPASFSEQHSQSDYESTVKQRRSKNSDRIHAIPGGVALALDHGSILIECAKKELHATTSIKNPCRSLPTRISIVFYQHKKLTRRYHGWYEEEAKQKARNEEAARQSLLKEQEAGLFNGRVSQFNFPGSSQQLFPAEILAEGFAYGHGDEDSSSECSDTLEYLHNLLEEEEEVEVETNEALSFRVPRAIPFSEREEPFFVEVPITRVDQLEEQRKHCLPILPQQQQYPFNYVSVPTCHTSSLSNSVCKPQDVITGSFGKWHA